MLVLMMDSEKIRKSTGTGSVPVLGLRPEVAPMSSMGRGIRKKLIMFMFRGLSFLVMAFHGSKFFFLLCLLLGRF